MRRLTLAAAVAVLSLFLIGCGGDGDGRPVFTAQTLSAQSLDGDISLDITGFTITPATTFGSVLFGVDDNDPNVPEYRAFLDFPLDGFAGGDVLPVDAIVLSATVELFVRDVALATTVATFMDLVSYSPPLVDLDFDSPPVSGVFRTLTFFASDAGRPVLIDVTPLVQEAQLLGLRNFQVRLLVDPANPFGLVEIDDSTNAALAPFLTVDYTL